jgi:hypothetical protein
MAEPIAIKQIKIGTENHDIDAKYWGGMESSIVNDLASKTYVNEKIFVGTMEQYNVAYSNGLVAEGALVIITEVNVTPGGGSGSGSEGDNSGTTTTAKLGVAVLGQMKLGQE